MYCSFERFAATVAGHLEVCSSLSGFGAILHTYSTTPLTKKYQFVRKTRTKMSIDLHFWRERENDVKITVFCQRPVNFKNVVEIIVFCQRPSHIRATQCRSPSVSRIRVTQCRSHSVSSHQNHGFIEICCANLKTILGFNFRIIESKLRE